MIVGTVKALTVAKNRKTNLYQLKQKMEFLDSHDYKVQTHLAPGPV